MVRKNVQLAHYYNFSLAAGIFELPPNTMAPLRVILVDERRLTRSGQRVRHKNPDFSRGQGRAGGSRSSKSSLFDIFLAESGRLKRIIAGMGFGATDCQDILQDVAIKAWRRPAKTQTAEHAAGWLIKVTVNQCLTEHRHRKRFCRAAAEILRRRSANADHSANPDDEAIDTEKLEIVLQTLQQVDGALLMPLVLRYFCDLKSEEIARILDQNPSTVRSRLREARMLLAGKLTERGVEP
jgi:RNA polymerase sigma-70 factor (ECF subfamily)